MLRNLLRQLSVSPARSRKKTQCQWNREKPINNRRVTGKQYGKQTRPRLREPRRMLVVVMVVVVVVGELINWTGGFWRWRTPASRRFPGSSPGAANRWPRRNPIRRGVVLFVRTRHPVITRSTLFQWLSIDSYRVFAEWSRFLKKGSYGFCPVFRGLIVRGWLKSVWYLDLNIFFYQFCRIFLVCFKRTCHMEVFLYLRTSSLHLICFTWFYYRSNRSFFNGSLSVSIDFYRVFAKWSRFFSRFLQISPSYSWFGCLRLVEIGLALGFQ